MGVRYKNPNQALKAAKESFLATLKYLEKAVPQFYDEVVVLNGSRARPTPTLCLKEKADVKGLQADCRKVEVVGNEIRITLFTPRLGHDYASSFPNQTASCAFDLSEVSTILKTVKKKFPSNIPKGVSFFLKKDPIAKVSISYLEGCATLYEEIEDTVQRKAQLAIRCEELRETVVNLIYLKEKAKGTQKKAIEKLLELHDNALTLMSDTLEQLKTV